MSFQTADKSIVKRLVKVLSNVGQESFQTFDKSVVKR